MSNKRFNHEEAFRGQDLATRLAQKFITICGVGTIGSNLVDTLVRQGVSEMRVIDKDRVEISNTATQVYGDMDVGAWKVDALCKRVFRHVGVEIKTLRKELTASYAKGFLKDSDLVIDCFDNTESRQLVQNECRASKIPCIHAGMSADGYGEVVWDDRYRVPQTAIGDVCDYPLARNLAMLVTTVLAEEVIDFCLNKTARKCSWSITLNDLAIRQMI